MPAKIQPGKPNDLINEPRGYKINWHKCAFLIISINHNLILNENSGFSQDLPQDLIDVSDLIGVLYSSPFEVKKESVITFFNSCNSEDIYGKLFSISQREGIDSVIVFYQGYSLIENSQLYMGLKPLISEDPSTYLQVDKIAYILQQKKDLNVIMFLDCNYSALAFNDFYNDNFVIISSCAKDQRAYFYQDLKTKASKSVFSSALVEAFKEASLGEDKNYSLSDFYLLIREKVIQKGGESANMNKQLPMISTRNLTQFYQFISGGSTSKVNHSVKRAYTFIELESLFIADELEEVIDVLYRGKVNFNDQAAEEITSHYAAFNKLKRTARLNMISHDDYQRSYSKIQKAVLEFTNELKKKMKEIIVEEITE